MLFPQPPLTLDYVRKKRIIKKKGKKRIIGKKTELRWHICVCEALVLDPYCWLALGHAQMITELTELGSPELASEMSTYAVIFLHNTQYL